MLTRQQLREATAEWERGERHESYLYHGARLAKVVEWRAAREGELNELEHEFLETSQKRQREEEQRWKELYEEAKQQARLARSGQLTVQAQGVLEKQEDRSGSLPLLLAREAVLTTFTADGHVTPGGRRCPAPGG